MSDQVEHELLKPTPLLQFGFGVGCAQFVPKNINEEFKSFDDYIAKLKLSLNEIAAIKDVKIQANNNLRNFSQGLPRPFPRLNDGEFSFLCGGTGVELGILLQLSIPTRTQRSILRREDDANWSGFSEIFVFINSEYSCPIMIVRGDGDTALAPSEAVLIVRKFLEKELDDNTNCKFLLDTIGPSPFHANFKIYQAPSGVDKDQIETSIKRGYDEINYFVRDALSNGVTFSHALFRELFDELDLFYFIMAYRLIMIRSWESLFDKVQKLQSYR
jgi:hypothetical protein